MSTTLSDISSSTTITLSSPPVKFSVCSVWEGLLPLAAAPPGTAPFRTRSLQIRSPAPTEPPSTREGRAGERGRQGRLSELHTLFLHHIIHKSVQTQQQTSQLHLCTYVCACQLNAPILTHATTNIPSPSLTCGRNAPSTSLFCLQALSTLLQEEEMRANLAAISTDMPGLTYSTREGMSTQ